jgi:hypothetical protein
MVNEELNHGQPIFRADLAFWRAQRGLSVELTSEGVYVSTRPAFMRKPVLKAEFETSAIDSFKIEDERQLTVTLFFEQSEEYLEFTRSEDAARMCDALRELLGPLDQVSKSKKRLDEEEKVRIETEKLRTARIQEYAARIWDVVDGYNLLAAGAYRVVVALRTEGWKEARDEYTSMWQRTKELDDRTGFSLLASLENVGQVLTEGDGPQVVKRLASFVEATTRSSMEDAPPGPEWHDAELNEATRPGWYDVRYFVLFSYLVHEMELACVLSDWGEIEAAVDGLARLSPAVESISGVSLGGRTECLRESVTKRDVIAAEECSHGLGDYLAASIQRSRSVEVRLNDGALPEPT